MPPAVKQGQRRVFKRAAPLALRPYQERIAAACVRANTIVLLPTGSGKTAVAAEAVARLLERHPHKHALMLVPTIPLVEQQAEALRRWIGEDGSPCVVGEYHGSRSLPRGCTVLVSTPKAFETAQLRGEHTCAWSHFAVVVFDEVHHAIKDHPYRNLAARLRNHARAASASGQVDPPRVLGLTASLTYAFGARKIAAAVEKLFAELCISGIETATPHELRSGGYTGSTSGTVAEVRDCAAALPAGVVPRAERKPHLMHSTFFRRVGTATATAFAHRLVRCVRSLEADVAAVDPEFASPLASVSISSWGV